MESLTLASSCLSVSDVSRVTGALVGALGVVALGEGHAGRLSLGALVDVDTVLMSLGRVGGAAWLVARQTLAGVTARCVRTVRVLAADIGGEALVNVRTGIANRADSHPSGLALAGVFGAVVD